MSDQVIRDWRGYQVPEVVRVQLAQEVRQDLQALERKATEVRLSIAELLCFIGDTNNM